MPGWPRWDGDGENTVVTGEKCPGSGGELRAASTASTVSTHHRLSFFRRVSSRQQREAGAGPNFVVMGAAPGTLAVDTVTLVPSC